MEETDTGISVLRQCLNLINSLSTIWLTRTNLYPGFAFILLDPLFFTSLHTAHFSHPVHILLVLNLPFYVRQYPLFTYVHFAESQRTVSQKSAILMNGPLRELLYGVLYPTIQTFTNHRMVFVLYICHIKIRQTTT